MSAIGVTYSNPYLKLPVLNTLLNILAVVLIALGFIFVHRGNPYAGEMFWYGPMEGAWDQDDGRHLRLALLGVALLLAGGGLLIYTGVIGMPSFEWLCWLRESQCAA